MCAIAKAANETKCKFFETPSPEQTLYENVVAGGTSSTGLTSSTVAIGSGSFDQSNALGVGGACIGDKTITIAAAGFSKTMVLPFGVVCPYLAQFGNLLVAISLLLAMRIVFREG